MIETTVLMKGAKSGDYVNAVVLLLGGVKTQFQVNVAMRTIMNRLRRNNSRSATCGVMIAWVLSIEIKVKILQSDADEAA